MKPNFEITVENIKCGGCANQIKTKLLAKPGITHVSVDVETGGVKIEADLSLKDAVVAQLLQLGYPEVGSVSGLKSAGAKAKSFVSCAVGRMTDEATDDENKEGTTK